MSDIFLVYSTFADEGEAVSVAETLLSERLIACANITATRSIYVWEGSLHNGPEAAMISKTVKEKVPEVIARIKTLHSFDVPCIVAYPLAEGYGPFLNWVKEETR